MKCPKCNSTDILEIFYGDPTEELSKKAEQGKIKLGGCEIQKENYYCKKCKNKWE